MDGFEEFQFLFERLTAVLGIDMQQRLVVEVLDGETGIKDNIKDTIQTVIINLSSVRIVERDFFKSF